MWFHRAEIEDENESRAASRRPDHNLLARAESADGYGCAEIVTMPAGGGRLADFAGRSHAAWSCRVNT